MSALVTAYCRPRLSPWAELIQQDALLVDRSKGTRHAVNSTTAEVLKYCNGNTPLNVIVNSLRNRFDDNPDVEQHVLELIETLMDQELIVLDGGAAAVNQDGHIVTSLEATTCMLDHLELLRSLVFSTLSIESAGRFQDDLESHLDDQQLQLAKDQDCDAAPMQDNRTLPYQGLLETETARESAFAIAREIKQLLPPNTDGDVELAGNAVYLRGAYMGWHSNHSRSDGRVYCSWAERDNANFFRYEHPITGEIITEWEHAGWNIKSFTIPPKHSRFWHCIGAGSLRFSLGFRYQLPT